MKGHYDPKGDVRHSNQEASEGGNDYSQAAKLRSRSQEAGTTPMFLGVGRLEVFIHRNDGYLKVKRDSENHDVHLTWIWTLGDASRHYVYVRVPYWECSYGLELLWGKMEQVDEGRLQPTLDRYNR